MRKKSILLALLALLVGVLALTAAACGGDDGGDDGGAAQEPGQQEEGQTVKIVSDLPLQGASRVQTEQMVRAIEFYLEQIGNKAGDYTIEYESFDDATAAKGAWDEAKCAENARSYAEDETIVGVVGTFNSGCAAIEIPILNEAGVAMVSPANTAVGLTHSGPGAEQGEPDKYYPTGERNYARVVASDEKQAAVGARYMKEELGLNSVYVLDDKEIYGKGVADAFEQSAPDVQLEIAGHEGWDKDAPNYRALMNKIRASGAEGLYLGGIVDNNGGQLIKDKVAVLGNNEEFPLFVSDGFVTAGTQEAAGPAAEATLGTAPTIPPENLTGAGQEFISQFDEQEEQPIEVYTIYAVAATQALLAAIEASDGTRESVVEQLFQVNLEDSVIGPLSFDENGDPASPVETVFRAEGEEWVFVDTFPVE